MAYQLSSINQPIQGSGTPGSGQTIQDLGIDDTASGYKQTITGFGAAVTDATVSTFNSISSDTLDTLLEALMTASGAGFSLMRHTIGSSDLSPDGAYSYDDMPPGETDVNLVNFALGDSGTAMVRLLAKMTAKQSSLQVVGTPWSPPGWMKENGAMMGNTTGNNLSDQYLSQADTQFASQYAQYFVKYINAFAAQGVKVTAIALQNEPLNSVSGMPSTYMYDHEQAALIKNYIGPAFAQAGLDTSIWAYDDNTDVPSYPQNVLNEAGGYTDTVAWHCYAPVANWTVLDDFHNQNPNVKQYMTECWTPADPYSWHQVVDFTIGPLQNWASGVMAWGLGTDANNGPHMSTGGCSDCRGLVTINGDGSYTLNPAYYYLAQFSRFMPRDAIVLSGTGDTTDSTQPGIAHVATLNPDGTRTVVILNTFEADVFVRLNTTTGQQWSGTVPMASVVTWILPVA